MDPISILVGAGIAVVSATGGLAAGRRRRKSVDTAPPICTCTHGLAFHDPKTSKCHGMANGKATRYGELFTSRAVAWEQVPCTCRQYIGPIPADQMLATFNTTGRVADLGND